MDKTLLITRKDIESNPCGSLVTILSAMLYPEDEAARESYLDSYNLLALNDSSENSRAEYIRGESEYLARVLGKYPDPEKLLLTSLYSRKKGRTGSPVARGTLSGQILIHLLNPSIGSLEKAYDEIRKRYDLNSSKIDVLYEGTDTPANDRPKKPSKALLRKVWSEYRNVSHLWGADCIVVFNKGFFLFHPKWMVENPANLAPHLSLFLGTASFNRKKLIESKIVSTSGPHIKDPLRVWNIVDEHMKPYQPIKVFYEKF